MNERKIGAILSYVNIAASIIIQFAYTPIMLRILGQNEFGVYSLSNSIVAYLGLLNFGFSGSYLKFYSKYKADKDILSIKKLNGIYMIVFTFIAILIFMGGYALMQNIELIIDRSFTASEIALTKTLMCIMTINMAVMMPNNVFTSIAVAHEKFLFSKMLSLLQTLGNPCLALPLLLLGYGSKGMSSVLLLLSVISLIINIIYCRQKLHVGFVFRGIDWYVLREIMSFSVFIFLWSIVDQLNWQVGKVILANLLGSTAVAIYTIGMQFTNLFMVFSTAISGVFNPQIYNYVYEKDAREKLTKLMIKVGRLQFYIVFYIWLGYVFFGRSFICLWAGKNYEEAYDIGLWLMTPILIALLQNTGIEILRAFNKHQIRTILHLVFAVVNVVISIPLTKMYGVIGCAIGSCISTFASSTLVSNYFYSKVIKLDMKAFFREIVGFYPVIILSSICGFCINKFCIIEGWGSLCLYGLIFSMVYAIVSICYGFNDYERGLFTQALAKLSIRLRN